MSTNFTGPVHAGSYFIGDRQVIDPEGRFVGPLPEAPAAPAALPTVILPFFLQTPRDAVLFIAPRACEVVSIQAAAGTPGGSRSALDVQRLTGDKAESLLAKPLSLRKADVLTGELAENKSLKAGDRLAVNFTGTLGDLADVAVALELRLL